MNQINEQPQQGLSLNVGDEMSRDITIHKNMKQEVIITTSDKIELVLIDTKEIFTSQRDWWTPFGLFISFLTTLCTADFKESMGINKDVWQAIFIILAIGSFFWFGQSFIKFLRYWGKDDLKSIINQIKIDTTNTK